ncbi:hypothetical protein C8R44DRAFT_877465 [Mycena epipterygia]|nr:hypothetical protein C8R44DRAFT_877465 [Mycena epipterygia]
MDVAPVRSHVDPAPYNYLAHLDPCVDCFGDDTRADQYMTTLIMSQGKHRADTHGAWYNKEGSDPDTIDIPAPSYPWFPPAHSTDLINMYGVDKKMYGVFDRLHDIWKVGSPGRVFGNTLQLAIYIAAKTVWSAFFGQRNKQLFVIPKFFPLAPNSLCSTVFGFHFHRQFRAHSTNTTPHYHGRRVAWDREPSRPGRFQVRVAIQVYKGHGGWFLAFGSA